MLWQASGATHRPTASLKGDNEQGPPASALLGGEWQGPETERLPGPRSHSQCLGGFARFPEEDWYMLATAALSDEVVVSCDCGLLGA